MAILGFGLSVMANLPFSMYVYAFMLLLVVYVIWTEGQKTVCHFLPFVAKYFHSGAAIIA